MTKIEELQFKKCGALNWPLDWKILKYSWKKPKIKCNLLRAAYVEYDGWLVYLKQHLGQYNQLFRHLNPPSKSIK
jgi:hypothetical protein